MKYKLVPNDTKEVEDWVASRVNARGFGDCTAIGFYDEAELIAGVVFSEYRKTDVMVSVATERRDVFHKEILEYLFSYPFQQLGCNRITAFAEVSNKVSNNQLKRLGFVLEGTLREITHDCKDGHLYGMLRRECRWIGE